MVSRRPPYALVVGKLSAQAGKTRLAQAAVASKSSRIVPQTTGNGTSGKGRATLRLIEAHRGGRSIGTSVGDEPAWIAPSGSKP